MQTTTKLALDNRPAEVSPVSDAYLCPQCRQPLAALRCEPCGLTVESDSGILDFISCNPSHRALQEEVDYWDEHVEEFPTCRLRKHTDTVQDYFRGKSFNKSAHRMLPELKDIDLRDKTCMEVGGTGHSLAMMLRSECKDLYHVEVSKQTQRITQQNIRQLSFGHDTNIRYLCSPAESIPLPDDTLDLVMAFGTYHHTKRPESLRRKLPQRNLRPPRRPRRLLFRLLFRLHRQPPKHHRPPSSRRNRNEHPLASNLLRPCPLFPAASTGSSGSAFAGPPCWVPSSSRWRQ